MIERIEQPSFEDALTALTASARAQKGRAVSRQTLRSFLNDELSEEEDERLKDDLVLRPEAARELLSMATLETLPRALWVWRAAAATFLVASLFAGSWAWRLDRQLAAEVGPRVNVPLASLLPAKELVRRGPGREQVVEIAPEVQRYVLGLMTGSLPELEGYRIEILKDRTAVWGASGLLPDRQGVFSIQVGRDFLPEGVYRIELYGLGEESSRLLAEYPLRIVHR